jgi:hypothetical protein
MLAAGSRCVADMAALRDPPACSARRRRRGPVATRACSRPVRRLGTGPWGRCGRATAGRRVCRSARTGRRRSVRGADAQRRSFPARPTMGTRGVGRPAHRSWVAGEVVGVRGGGGVDDGSHHQVSSLSVRCGPRLSSATTCDTFRTGRVGRGDFFGDWDRRSGGLPRDTLPLRRLPVAVWRARPTGPTHYGTPSRKAATAPHRPYAELPPPSAPTAHVVSSSGVAAGLESRASARSDWRSTRCSRQTPFALNAANIPRVSIPGGDPRTIPRVRRVESCSGLRWRSVLDAHRLCH